MGKQKLKKPRVPVITSIKPQKNKKRVNIYLDGKFGFGLDLENFVKLGLTVEQELTEERINEIVKLAEFQKTYEKITKFATLRPRSEKEIKDWLKKKKVHQSLHKELFNRLKRLELVDDKKFARWWVEQRLNFRPRSKRAMVYELKNKGISKEIIEEIFSIQRIDEEKIAEKLLKSKNYRWRNLPGAEARKKMAAFLQRKGFGWPIIKKALDKAG